MRIFLLILLFGQLTFSAEASQIGDVKEANQFWTAFRRAVLNSKLNQVISLTRFPFEIRGQADWMPVKYYKPGNFRPIFEEVMESPVSILSNGNFVEKSMIEIIIEKKTITAKDWLTPKFIRIEDLEFQRIDGNWRFTGAYLDQ